MLFHIQQFYFKQMGKTVLGPWILLSVLYSFLFYKQSDSSLGYTLGFSTWLALIIVSFFAWSMSPRIKPEAQRDKFLISLPMSRHQVAVSVFIAPAIYFGGLFIVSMLTASLFTTSGVIEKTVLINFLSINFMYVSFAYLFYCVDTFIKHSAVRIIVSFVLAISFRMLLLPVEHDDNYDFKNPLVALIYTFVCMVISMTIALALAKRYINDFVNKDIP